MNTINIIHFKALQSTYNEQKEQFDQCINALYSFQSWASYDLIEPLSDNTEEMYNHFLDYFARHPMIFRHHDIESSLEIVKHLLECYKEN